MPAIRGISKSASLTSERRKVLRDEFIDELSGKSSTDDLLIFEIPLEQLSNGKVELRFPTMAMAEEAHQRLSERLPGGYWSILETIGQVP
jgi:hypothetical protein